MVFDSDESDEGIGSKHWSLPYQWDARIFSTLSSTLFETMIATCLPSLHIPCFCWVVEQFEDQECFF